MLGHRCFFGRSSRRVGVPQKLPHVGCLVVLRSRIFSTVLCTAYAPYFPSTVFRHFVEHHQDGRRNCNDRPATTSTPDLVQRNLLIGCRILSKRTCRGVHR